MGRKYDDEDETVTATRDKEKVKQPRLYRVLLHNDDYTTREFVVYVLQTVFHKSENDAVRVMLHVHHNGVGVAGVYSYEVAETKLRTVEQMAREQEFPLRLSMEPEAD